MEETPTVQVGELRGNLAKFLSEVEHGAEFVVMSRGRPIARLPPIQRTGGVVFGLLNGKLDVSDDFDDPLPDDILDATENGSIFP